LHKWRRGEARCEGSRGSSPPFIQGGGGRQKDIEAVGGRHTSGHQ
jgi:hypothetical protein